jgi:hypothetical protein
MWNKLGTVGGLQKVGALVMAVVAIAYAFLLVTTFMRYKSGKKVDRLIIFLLVLSIFTFNMAFGNVKPAPRVYFGTFSVVFASILYIWTNKKSVQLKWLSIAIALFSVVFTMSLSQKANNSYTNDAILSQNVAMFAKDNKIEKTPISKTGALFNEAGFNSNGGLNKVNANVVFLGNLQVGNQGIISKFQDIFITGATRSSFFQFDPPLTSMRPYDFMRTQGYEFKIPDQSLREKMTLQYAQLPVYPNTGSMVYDKANQTIVVKLSN